MQAERIAQYLGVLLLIAALLYTGHEGRKPDLTCRDTTGRPYYVADYEQYPDTILDTITGNEYERERCEEAR